MATWIRRKKSIIIVCLSHNIKQTSGTKGYIQDIFQKINHPIVYNPETQVESLHEVAERIYTSESSRTEFLLQFYRVLALLVWIVYLTHNFPTGRLRPTVMLHIGYKCAKILIPSTTGTGCWALGSIHLSQLSPPLGVVKEGPTQLVSCFMSAVSKKMLRSNKILQISSPSSVRWNKTTPFRGLPLELMRKTAWWGHPLTGDAQQNFFFQYIRLCS